MSTSETRRGPEGQMLPTTSSLRMVAVMGSVGLIASVLLVATYQITAPYIERNRRAFLERAIFDVIPEAVRFRTFSVGSDGTLAQAEDSGVPGQKLYAGYDAADSLRGVAIEAAGQGYGDVIRIIFGYSPDCECVIGMKVIESKETPGLGDKIEKDESFRANFERLDVRLASDGLSLVHPVELVKRGEKTDAWQIEAITGATVSSRAIASIIGESTASVLPIVDRELEQLRMAR